MAAAVDQYAESRGTKRRRLSDDRKDNRKVSRTMTSADVERDSELAADRTTQPDRRRERSRSPAPRTPRDVRNGAERDSSAALPPRENGRGPPRGRDRPARGGDRDRRRSRSRSPARDGRDRYDREGARHRSPARDSRDARSRSPKGHDRAQDDRDRRRPRSPQPGRDAPRGRPPPSGPRGRVALPGVVSGDSNLRGHGVAMNVAAKLGDDELDEMMAKVMGFKAFRSTKDTKVPGNDKLYGVRKEKKTEYRQYMNRQGGFNRPLSPSHE